MKTILTNVAIFAAGAVTGGFVVWTYIKPKLEEAIEKATATPTEPEAEPTTESDVHKHVPKQVSMDEYRKILEETQYHTAATVEEEKRPHVITPEEFGDDDRDTVEFTYYADGILADECGEMIDDEDIEAFVGKENLKRMGEYEKDVLYIRNDNQGVQGTDYIICKDLSTYESIVKYEPFAPETE